MNETTWKTDNQSTTVEDFSTQDMLDKLNALRSKKRYENFTNVPLVESVHDKKVVEGLDNGFLNGYFGLNDSDYDGHDNVKDEKEDINKGSPFSAASDAISRAIKYIMEIIPHFIYYMAILIYLIFSGGDTINTDGYGPDDLRKSLNDDQRHDIDLIYNYICWTMSIILAIPLTYSLHFFSFYKETVVDENPAPKEAFNINDPTGTRPTFDSPGGDWIPLLFGFDYKKTMELYCGYGNDEGGKFTGLQFLLIPLFLLFEPAIHALDIIHNTLMVRFPSWINTVRESLQRYGIRISLTMVFFVLAVLFSNALYYGSGYLKKILPEMLKFKFTNKKGAPYPLVIIILFVTLFPYLSTALNLGKMFTPPTADILSKETSDKKEDEDGDSCKTSMFGNGLYIPYVSLGFVSAPVALGTNILIFIANTLRFMFSYMTSMTIVPLYTVFYVLMYVIIRPITLFGNKIGSLMKNIDISKLADGEQFNSFYTTADGIDEKIDEAEIRRVLDSVQPSGFIGWITNMSNLVSRLSTTMFFPVFTLLFMSLLGKAAKDFSITKNNNIRGIAVPLLSASTVMMFLVYIRGILKSDRPSARMLLKYLGVSPSEGLTIDDMAKQLELIINKHGKDTENRWDYINEEFKGFFNEEMKDKYPAGDWAKYGKERDPKNKAPYKNMPISDFKQGVYRYLTHAARKYMPIHALMRDDCAIRKMFHMNMVQCE